MPGRAGLTRYIFQATRATTTRATSTRRAATRPGRWRPTPRNTSSASPSDPPPRTLPALTERDVELDRDTVRVARPAWASLLGRHVLGRPPDGRVQHFRDPPARRGHQRADARVLAAHVPVQHVRPRAQREGDAAEPREPREYHALRRPVDPADQGRERGRRRVLRRRVQ